MEKRRHPCQFSPEVLDVVRDFIDPGEHVHDPYAGPGLRLGRLCDRLGARFTGTDIEDWGNLPDGRDERVRVADARDPAGYPPSPFTVVTSPVYFNKRCADYPNGATRNTNDKGRRDYGIALGRALHAENFARHTGRPRHADRYWQGHADALRNWGHRVIVNVDEPIFLGWHRLLSDAGYHFTVTVPVRTRRYGGLANAERRAEFEVVILAVRQRNWHDSTTNNKGDPYAR